MTRSMFTATCVALAFGIASCAPARSPQPANQSHLSQIQNRLEESDRKLDQLSQQVALIQALVDNHQRTLQELGKSGDSLTDTEVPVSVSTVTEEATEQSESLPEEVADPIPPVPEPVRQAVDLSETAPVPTEERPPAVSVHTPLPEPLPEEATELPVLPSDPAPTGLDATAPDYQEAMAIFRNGDYEAAAPLFENFVQTFPENSLSDNALYWAGECKYAQKKFREAIRRFERVVEEYPAGSKVPDALLKIGFAYISLGDMASAETYLKKVIAQHPFSSAGAMAENRLKTLQKN